MMASLRFFLFSKHSKIFCLLGIFLTQPLLAETSVPKTQDIKTQKTISVSAENTPESLNSRKTDFFDYTHSFYRETKTVNNDKQSETKREYVTQTIPGEELLAVANYTYKKEKPTKEVVFTLPIPQETIYVEGSATDEKDVWFSSDNQTSWSRFSDLRVTEANGTKRLATTKDITHLQWRMTKDLKKGDTGTLEYRIIIR